LSSESDPALTSTSLATNETTAFQGVDDALYTGAIVEAECLLDLLVAGLHAGLGNTLLNESLDLIAAETERAAWLSARIAPNLKHGLWNAHHRLTFRFLASKHVQATSPRSFSLAPLPSFTVAQPNSAATSIPWTFMLARIASTSMP
jgi:hypothetical protein